MSILIKGLGMPNAHQVLRFYLKGNGDGTATVYEYTTGMQTGVAVPIPEKHGRLIDADANISVLDKCCMATESAYERSFYSFAAQIMRECPAIIEAEGGGEDGK